MFNHPSTYDFVKANRARLLKYEQLCTDCRRWYEVPLADLIRDLEYQPPPGQIGKPFVDCVCTHCKARLHIICPGKYDSHRAKRPSMQRYTFSEDAAPASPKVGPGVRFRQPIADCNALFEVKRRQGRGAWLCVVVDEPIEINGKTYPSDYAGEQRVFLTDQITAAVAWERHAKQSRDAHEAYYESLKVGQIVHYMNMPREFVRCEVVEKDGKRVLRRLALVGEWFRNNTGDFGYRRTQIQSGETFTPNYTCIYESPACNRARCIDPTKLAPIDLGGPVVAP